MSIPEKYLPPFLFSISIILTLPPFDFWPASFFMYVPLFYSWQRKESKFIAVLCQGLCSGLLISLFLFHTGFCDKTQAKILYIVILIFFIIYFTFLFLLLYIPISYFKVWGFLLTPLLILIYEKIFEQLPGVFPLYTALSISGNSLMIGKIGRFGISGIGSLIILMNAVIFYTFFKKTGKIIHRSLILFITAILLFIPLRISDSDSRTSKESIKIGYIQGSVPYWKFFFIGYSNTFKKNITEEYLRYLENVTQTDCIILPESAIKGDKNEINENIKNICRIAKKRSMHIIFNSAYYENNGKIYNAAIHINRKGKITEIYRKINLVAIDEANVYSRGNKTVLFDIDENKAGILICYDALFSSVYKKQMEQGADFLIALSNDSFAGQSAIPWLHFTYSRLFSAQYGIPVIHAAQSGCSGTAFPSGTKEGILLPFEKGIKKIDI